MLTSEKSQILFYLQGRADTSFWVCSIGSKGEVDGWETAAGSESKERRCVPSTEWQDNLPLSGQLKDFWEAPICVSDGM